MPLRYDSKSKKLVSIDEQDEVVEEAISNATQTPRAQLINEVPPGNLKQIRQDIEDNLGNDDGNIFLEPDDPNVQNTLNRVVRFNREKNQFADSLEQIERNDPLLTGMAKRVMGAIAAGGGSALGGIGRVLNVDTAIEAGATRGLIKHLRNQGSVLDAMNAIVTATTSPAGFVVSDLRKDLQTGIQDGLRDNLSFGDILREDLNVSQWGAMRFGINIRPLTPTNIIRGVTQDEINRGDVPEEIKPFTPILTGRGAVGLALDILLSPITYLSFGATAGAKVTAKGAGKSVLRFANQTVMNDVQLKAGIAGLKASRAGRETMRILDVWAASMLGRTATKIGSSFLEKFSTTFGRHKQTTDALRKAERQMFQGRAGVAKSVEKIFRGFSKEEKFEFFDTLFKAQKAEAAVGKKKLPRVKFANPKMEAAAERLLGEKGLMRELSNFAGIPDEVLFNNYIPSIFEEVVTKSMGGRKNFLRFKKSKGALKKRFVREGVVEDPALAFLKRATELSDIGHTNNALKKIISRHAKDDLGAGIREFIPDPRGKFRFFKAKTIEGREILAVGKKKKIFLPDEVLKSMEDFAARNTASRSAAIRMLDQGTQIFKAYVTAPFPAFNFRNFGSNRVLRFLEEGWKSLKIGDDLLSVKILSNAPDLGRTSVKLAREKGDITVFASKIKKWAHDDGITDTSQFIADQGGKNFDNVGEAFSRSKFMEFMLGNRLLKGARKVGAFIENEAKLAAYIRALKDGLSRKEATQIAFNGLFDYGALTAFERTTMRRIMPFYTFSRKNFGLQVKTLLRNPGRQKLVFDTMRTLRDEAVAGMSDEQKIAFNELSGWLTQNSFAVPAGFDAEGQVMWMTGIGLPQTDFVDSLDLGGIMFKMNPLLKIPIEQIGNVDLVKTIQRGTTVSLKDQYRSDEFRWLFPEIFAKDRKPSKDDIREFLESPKFKNHPMKILFDFKIGTKKVFKRGREVGTEPVLNANPRMLEIIRNTFVARSLSTAKQFSDPNMDQTLNLVRFLTGIAFYKQNLDASIAGSRSRLKKEAGVFMKEQGEGFQLQITGTKRPDVKRALKRLRKK